MTPKPLPILDSEQSGKGRIEEVKLLGLVGGGRGGRRKLCSFL